MNTKSKPVVVAGIGGKQCPESVLSIMESIGEVISNRSWWLRSGHSEGGDYSFEIGANGRSILYLPYKKWGEERKYLVYNKERQVICFSELQNNNKDLYEKVQLDISKYYHKSWKKLSVNTKALLCRIYILLLGAGKVRRPADVLICYSPPPPPKNKKEDSKETESEESEEEDEEEEEEDEELINEKESLSLAIKIAEDFDIPVIDLGTVFYRKLKVEDVLDFIEQAIEVRGDPQVSSDDHKISDIDSSRLNEDIKEELMKIIINREKSQPKGRIVALSEI